jgi:hypothetical protein
MNFAFSNPPEKPAKNQPAEATPKFFNFQKTTPNQQV